MLKQCKSQYESDPRIRQILAAKPEVLRMFGMEPDVVARDLEAADSKRNHIMHNFDQIHNQGLD